MSDVLKNPSTALVNAGDDILITWIINQNIQKIPNNLGNLFQGNIFYPYENTMAYSDLFLPSSLIAYIPVKLTGLPILGYNINLFVGQIATMLVIYLWFLEMMKNKTPSLLGSIALGLSQIRIHYYAHLQMWNMQWWLLASWMIWKFSKLGKVKYLYFAGVTVAIQFWESVLPVYFFGAVASIVLLPKIKELLVNWRHLLVIFLVTFFLTFPAIKTYYEVSFEFNYQRSIRDAAHFSMSVNDLGETFLSPGLYSLFLISLVIIFKKLKTQRNNLYWLSGLLIFGILMSFGPVLKWEGATVKFFDKYFIPLPYGLFYYTIPGFTALRTPLRWLWVSTFAASGFIAFSISLYKSRIKYLVLLGGFAIAILGGRQVPVETYAPTPDKYPEVYSFLKRLPGDAILELPMYTWGHGEIYKQEFWRMLYSLEHKKNLVNGTSGFTPLDREILAGNLEKDFPSIETEEILSEINVNYILVHKNQFTQDKIVIIKSWGKEKLIWEDAETLVYKL
ncbi:hypothetical protein A2714_00375 [Candidatus Woesebacteria bacterium RIFCSPHIGHO2_01_FULL_38_9]|uniref:Glycosyltransferase RgtA/B/C/D-like domain-containing protein n=1 Tax=Candidatus Woesebacteria bacterium RIFCSPHIGHO2_01_FULL_38_9 TaxID=1802492 RepID=A0A1F7Y2U4_9BACT|nr:MAG: hypothetical protein A2714_00375 [Candidatus Woesebacteria bacterium RIFCSPHIGHO2_01_FULL_38_9]